MQVSALKVAYVPHLAMVASKLTQLDNFRNLVEQDCGEKTLSAWKDNLVRQSLVAGGRD